MESENKVQNNIEYDNSNNDDRITDSSEYQDNDRVKKEVKESDSHSTVPAEE
jgi:hypothetical protein